MTGTVACSLSAAFRPSPPRGMIRSTTPSWVASWRSSSRSPPATIEIARRRASRPRRRHAATTWASTAFEWAAIEEPAQHDRVARLEAERRAVHGHVGPRLVDHGDHAQRDAHPPHVEAVLQPVAVDRLAHRIGQRGDRAHVAGDAGQALLVELQPVEQARVEPGLAARLHVALVGLEDLLARAPRRRPPSPRARRSWCRRRAVASSARRVARAGADLGVRRSRSWWPRAKGTRSPGPPAQAVAPRARTAPVTAQRPPRKRSPQVASRTGISATRPTQTPTMPRSSASESQGDRHERAERRGEHAPHQEARVARADEDAVEREHRPVGGLHQREQGPDLLRAVDHRRVARERARQHVGEGEHHRSEHRAGHHRPLDHPARRAARSLGVARPQRAAHDHLPGDRDRVEHQRQEHEQLEGDQVRAPASPRPSARAPRSPRGTTRRAPRCGRRSRPRCARAAASRRGSRAGRARALAGGAARTPRPSRPATRPWPTPTRRGPSRTRR